MALLVLQLAGCSEPEPEVVVQYVDRPVTVTTTTTVTYKPPTFLKIIDVRNEAGGDWEIQVQGYSLGSTGTKSTSGFAIRSILVTTDGTNTLSSDNYPSCNERMEGIQVTLRRISDNEIADSGGFPGVHCSGDEKSYGFSILAGGDVRFGTR